MDWNGADAQQKEPFQCYDNIYFVKFLFEQFKLEKNLHTIVIREVVIRTFFIDHMDTFAPVW